MPQPPEEQMSPFLESLQDAILVLDPRAGQVRFANGLAARLFGYPHAELTGVPVDRLVADAFREVLSQALHSIPPVTSQSAQTTRINLSGRRKDGTEFFSEWLLRPLKSEGSVLVTATVRNVAGQWVAETTLLESEARFSSFMDNLPGLAWIKDAEGRYVYFNETYAKLFQVSLAEWRGKTDTDVWPPETAAQYQANDRLVLYNRKILQTVESTPHDEGPRYWLTTKFPILSQEGAVVAVGGVAVEITESKQAREQIQQEKEFSSGIINSSVDGIMAFDRDCRYTVWNPAMERLSGIGKEQCLGRCAFEVFPFLKDIGEDTFFYAALEGQTIVAKDRPFTVAGTGRQGFFEGYYSPLRGKTGEIIGGLAIIRDVTDRKRLEEQVLQGEKMEAIGRLAGGVAHDFNNLLTVILGYAELLSQSQLDPEALQAHLDPIRSAADRASLLTNQLLSLSRKEPQRPTTLNLNDVVIAQATMLKPVVGDHIELVTRIDPALGPIKADPAQLEQLFLNLAINAREAMDHHGTLTLETANHQIPLAAQSPTNPLAHGSYARLTVSDTGRGLDAEAKARIFEPFFSTKKESTGTGLGMALVYGIVSQSGGHIEVASEPGQGTRVTMWFPHSQERVAAPSVPTLFSKLPGGTETVLLVEDERMLRNMVGGMLSKLGYRVLEAGEGEEALQVSQQHEGFIHLLLTDVRMPGMDGPQVAEAVLANRPDTKVIFMSGYTGKSILPLNLMKNEHAYLEKPFRIDTLAHKVRSMLDSVP